MFSKSKTSETTPPAKGYDYGSAAPAAGSSTKSTFGCAS